MQIENKTVVAVNANMWLILWHHKFEVCLSTPAMCKLKIKKWAKIHKQRNKHKPPKSFYIVLLKPNGRSSIPDKKNVDVLGEISAKSVGYNWEKCWCIESKHATNMRATGAECLESGVLSRWLKHSTENLDIGNDNGYTVTLQASRMKEMQSDYLIQD